MASNPPGKCCAEGFKHEGAPIGDIVKFAGVDTYVTGDKTSKKVLVFITDIYGYNFNNNQLVADEYGQKGYYVIVPDMFNNDPVPAERPPGFDLMKDWLPKHMPDQTCEIIRKTIAQVKEDIKPTYLVATGYCYGAKLAIRLLGDKSVDAAAAFHPSFVTLDEVASIQGPLYIAAAEEDPIFTEELRHQTEAKLKELKKTYYISLSSGVAHGFSVRGDVSIPIVKFAKEEVFRNSLSWFGFFEK